jgi:hypothetical protein
MGPSVVGCPGFNTQISLKAGDYRIRFSRRGWTYAVVHPVVFSLI